MILVIDTSSAVSAMALVEPSGAVLREDRVPSRDPRLRPLLRELGADVRVTKVAVATGPGSFTGLRVGVSFGLGLAIGRRIPIVPLPTLALQAARAAGPSTGVSEAGRGRFYHALPGRDPALGAPEQIPLVFPLAGLLTERSRAALEAAGHVVLADAEMRAVGAAAASLLETASEVPYGRLKLDYMPSAFAAQK